MDNKASKHRELNIAFLVDAALLRRLAIVLAEVGKPPEYKVKFSDDMVVEYGSVEDIINQLNTRQRSIVSVTASTSGENQESVYLFLSSSPSPQHVEYIVNGPQQRVKYVGSQLDDWVAAIRQWYSPFFLSVFPLLIFSFAVYAPIFLWEHIAPHFLPEEIAQGKNDSWIRGWSLIGMWLAEALAIRLFPRATFAIGQGAKRHDFLKYLRNTVVCFVLAVLAGMVANLLKR